MDATLKMRRAIRKVYHQPLKKNPGITCVGAKKTQSQSDPVIAQKTPRRPEDDEEICFRWLPPPNDRTKGWARPDVLQDIPSEDASEGSGEWVDLIHPWDNESLDDVISPWDS